MQMNLYKRRDGGAIILESFLFEERIYRMLTDDNLSNAERTFSFILRKHVQGKIVSVLPCYGVHTFLFKMFGAKKVIGLHKDPTTITWLETVRRYFFYENIGRVLLNLDEECQSPNVPEMFRQSMVMIKLQQLIKQKLPEREFVDIFFRVGSLGDPSFSFQMLNSVISSKTRPDLIWIPYLFDVKRGILERKAIIQSLRQIREMSKKRTRIFIGPCSARVYRLAESFGLQEETRYNLCGENHIIFKTIS